MTSTDDLENKALVRAFVGGDESAFDKLYTKFRLAVRTCAAETLGVRLRDSRVDDMAQETWLGMIRRAPFYKPRPNAKFSTWLLQITANVCVTELRRKEREEKFLARYATSGLVPRDVPEPTYQDLDGEDFVRDFQGALGSLPGVEREAFLLRQEEGLTFREVALRMRVSVAWVQKLIVRSLDSLQKQLAKYGPDPRLVAIEEQALDGVPRERRASD